MDEDFAFDDTVGRETVELDDLPIDEEKDMEIKFKKGNVYSINVYTFWLTRKLW